MAHELGRYKRVRMVLFPMCGERKRVRREHRGRKDSRGHTKRDEEIILVRVWEGNRWHI